MKPGRSWPIRLAIRVALIWAVGQLEFSMELARIRLKILLATKLNKWTFRIWLSHRTCLRKMALKIFTFTSSAFISISAWFYSTIATNLLARPEDLEVGEDSLTQHRQACRKTRLRAVMMSFSDRISILRSTQQLSFFLFFAYLYSLL